MFWQIPLESVWEGVLWENVGAEMLIGCVRNFLVLRICHKVDMGHVLSGFHVFSNLLFWLNAGFLENVTFLMCLAQNPTTKMTAWTMVSFEAAGHHAASGGVASARGNVTRNRNFHIQGHIQ